MKKTNEINIIALDLGTVTGWAAKMNGNLISGTETFRTDRFSGGGMRFLRFRRWFEEILGAINPTAVYYEEVRRHMSTDAAHVYGGFMAALTSICEERSIPYCSIPVGTIKKHATGKGNASKDLMVSSARERWPDQDIKDDNQADAIWILSTATAEK